MSELDDNGQMCTAANDLHIFSFHLDHVLYPLHDTFLLREQHIWILDANVQYVFIRNKIEHRGSAEIWPRYRLQSASVLYLRFENVQNDACYAPFVIWVTLAAYEILTVLLSDR